MNFESMGKKEEVGLVVHYTDGDPCMFGNRETYIHFVCDLEVGDGEPVANDPHEEPRCVYHFTWRSSAACPVCSQNQLETSEGECVDGFMTTVTQKKEGELCNIVPMERIGECEMPVKVEPMQGGIIALIVILVVLGLVIGIIVLYKRRQVYEYKYDRLVGTSEDSTAGPATELEMYDGSAANMDRTTRRSDDEEEDNF